MTQSDQQMIADIRHDMGFPDDPVLTWISTAQLTRLLDLAETTIAARSIGDLGAQVWKSRAETAEASLAQARAELHEVKKEYRKVHEELAREQRANAADMKLAGEMLGALIKLEDGYRDRCRVCSRGPSDCDLVSITPDLPFAAGCDAAIARFVIARAQAAGIKER